MKIKNIFKYILFSIFIFFNLQICFSAKYTIVNGKEFNNRIKLSLNINNNSSSPEYSIKGFKYSPILKGNPIDISEDGDSSVLAYIDNHIIYYVSDDDVYLNEDASYMFDKFINLQEVELQNLNFSKTKKMNFMFSNCKYLKKLDMDNDSIIRLNEIEGMFYNCQSIFDLNIFMLNTQNVKNMNSLFYNCKNLKDIYINPNIWSINNVNNFNKMFYNCLSLKSNYNLKATDIDETKYHIYAVAGSEFREGFLRDYDYDYDEIKYTNQTIKVDSLNEKIIDITENKNQKSNINESEIIKSKKFLNVKISSNSELYEHISSDRINLDKNMKNDKYINSNTLEDVPILKEETTFVEFLTPKNSIKSTNSLIIPSSDDNNGIIRHNYDFDNFIKSSNSTTNNQTSNNESRKNEQFNDNIYNILLFIVLIMIVFIGYIISNKKYKNFGNFE